MKDHHKIKENLHHSLMCLNEALSESKDSMLAIDGTIQRFEFTFELSWKLLQALLQREGFDVKSPREALQKAYKLEWINDQPLWLNMLKDRNMISHTYHEDLAKEIYDRIGSYYHAMQTLYDVIKTTSD